MKLHRDLTIFTLKVLLAAPVMFALVALILLAVDRIAYRATQNVMFKSDVKKIYEKAGL